MAGWRSPSISKGMPKFDKDQRQCSRFGLFRCGSVGPAGEGQSSAAGQWCRHDGSGIKR